MTSQYVQRIKDTMPRSTPMARVLKWTFYIHMKNPNTDEIHFDGPYQYFPRTMARLGFPPSHLRSLGRKRFLHACKELLLANQFQTLAQQATYIHAQLAFHFSELRYLPHGPQQNPFARRDVLDRSARKFIKEYAQAVMQTIPSPQKSTATPSTSHA